MVMATAVHRFHHRFHALCTSLLLCIVVWTCPYLIVSALTTANLPNKQGANGRHQHVIVVGAGVGGLAVASRILAAAEPTCTVTILEKNSYAGGRCGSVNVTTPQGTFRHERGPSLLLLPQVYRDLFLDCHCECPLDMKPCNPAYQVVFDDGDRIDLGFPKQQQQEQTDEMKQAEQKSRAKMDAWEPHGAAHWDEYLAACSAFLDCGLPNFIQERLHLSSLPAFLYQALRENLKAWPLKPHSTVLEATFASTKMRALASFQDLYVGLEPYRNPKQLFGGVLDSTAPAVFGLLAAIELHPTNSKGGVYAPVGGFAAVTASMKELAENLGADIQCGQTVTKITEEGVYYHDAEGAGQFASADLVIVNADLPYATKTMLLGDSDSDDKVNDEDDSTGTNDRYDWDDKYRFSSGVIAFHWSMDTELHDLNTHNVFMSASSQADAEASWKTLRDEPITTNVVDDDAANKPFNFYVHRASKTDPTAAPKGCDAIMVLVPCDTLSRDPSLAKLPRGQAVAEYKKQFDEERISRVRDAVFRRFSAIDSLKDFKSHILDEFVDTPGTYADRYNLGAGTPFALSHGFAQLSLTRPGPSSSKLPNVLFCGASSRPGNGVPLVLMGAELVAKRAVSKLRTPQIV